MVRLRRFEISLVVFLLISLLALIPIYSQNKKSVLPDTTKKTAQNTTRLNLPDVIIYGEDKAIRKAGEKINRLHERAKLIAPDVDFIHIQKSSFVDQKSSFPGRIEKSGSRKRLQLSYGRFQEINLKAGWWQEHSKFHFSGSGEYSRSSGQYENSQYSKNNFESNFGTNLTNELALNSQLGIELLNYGIYGAQINGLKRNASNISFHLDNRWMESGNQSLFTSFHFRNSRFQDEGLNFKKSDLNEQQFGIEVNYHLKYRTAYFFIKTFYNHYDLQTTDGENLSQNYFRINPSLVFPLAKYLSFNLGIIYEDMEAQPSFSRSRLSPEIQVIFTPLNSLGVKFRGSRGFIPVKFSQWWERNLFISQNFGQTPIIRQYEFNLAVEYFPGTFLSVKSEFNRQRLKQGVYWKRNSESGLFELQRLDCYDVTEWRTTARLNISSKIVLEGGIIYTFDSIKDDSLQSQSPHLPYTEKISLPVNLKYRLNNTFLASIHFKLVGPRHVSLISDETLRGYGLFSIELEKRIYNYFSTYLVGNNLLNQDYQLWQGYPAMGIHLTLGIQANW